MSLRGKCINDLDVVVKEASSDDQSFLQLNMEKWRLRDDEEHNNRYHLGKTEREQRKMQDSTVNCGDNAFFPDQLHLVNKFHLFQTT